MKKSIKSLLILSAIVIIAKILTAPSKTELISNNINAENFKNVESVKKYLLTKPDLEPKCKPYQICKPLAYAAQFGNIEILKLLIDAGANPNGKNAYGDTAFITATHASKLATKTEEKIKDVLKFLLKNGTNPNQTNDFGITPFMGLTAQGYIELMGVALKYGAKINFQNESGFTALMASARYKQPKAALWLIERGANLDSKDKNSETAYDYAVKYKASDIEIWNPNK